MCNFQDDAEVAQRAIPEIVKLLNDVDQSVVAKTISLVEQLSTKEASRYALATSQSLITALLNLIKNSNDSEKQIICASALKNLCNNHQGLLTIFKSGGISTLVKLLGSGIDAIVYYATSTLHNLLLFQDSAKIQVMNCGGIQKFVALLNSNSNLKLLTLVLDCLHILSFSNSEGKLIIAASGGSKELVNLMQAKNYEKLVWTAIRLMKVLSICPTNKPLLIKSGALMVLTESLLKPINDKILLNCLLTIRNLSDSVTKEDHIEGLIRKLIEMMNLNSDINVSICCAGILSNLTCNNDVNKTRFVEYNGIETLVRTLVQTNNQCGEILEPVICTLRHVTNRHTLATKAQESIRFNYGLPVIVNILQSENSRWPLIKACIGLIKNVSLSESNLASLRELGVIPRLVQLLLKSINLHQLAEKNGKETVVDEIPMEEIIEGTVGALHQISKDHRNRAILRDLKCIPLLTQLLFMSMEIIQKVACGCLCELTNDKEGTAANRKRACCR